MLNNPRLAPLATLALTFVGACSSAPFADTTGSTGSSTGAGGADTPLLKHLSLSAWRVACH